jgi:hypothetical protein
VEGSDGEWLIYQMSSDYIQPDEVGVIENSKMKFHLGMENGDYSIAGGRYGYFSDFSEFSLPYDSLVDCEGEEILLDAGPGYDDYLWNTGENTREITVDQSGYYIVEVKEDGDACLGIDSVKLTFHEYPELGHLPPYTEKCFADSVLLIAGPDSLDYQWNTGQIDSSLYVGSTGIYVVSVTNRMCTFYDTAIVEYAPEPVVDVGPDTTLCDGGLWSITLDRGFDLVEWNTGDTTHTVEFSDPGEYIVNIEAVAGSAFCGSDADTIIISASVLEAYNVVTPNGDGHNDEMEFGGIELGAWALDVYDRWGSLVFQHLDYDNSWSPIEVEDGMYYYQIQGDGICEYYKGWVMVVR